MPSSAPSASDDVLHSLSEKKEPVLTQHLYLTLLCVCVCVPSSEVLAAAVVADLPRVRGETETIVGLGLN